MQFAFSQFRSATCRIMVLFMLGLGLGGVASASVVGASDFFTPHHSGTGPKTGENAHYYYFPSSGDADHFAWGNATPATPGPITVKYDFRSQNGYANLITPEQQAAAETALNAWSAATGGKLQFVQDSAAADRDIINIGTGDLAAVSFDSAAGGVLGYGGGTFTHAGAIHSISNAAVWLDFAETWDATYNNGDPGGGYDYFTVVAQEIGHALGLGHTTAPGSIMNDTYSGELTALAAIDIEHIRSVYGVAAVPLPAGVWLLGSGLAWVFYVLRIRRRSVQNGAKPVMA